jgi:uncharacterized membrane protein (DUF2068 family)
VAGRRTRWQAETFVCSLRGHCAPAATVAELRPEDAGLGVDLPDGRRMARCTRCDAWVAGPVPDSPDQPSLPPLTELEMPRRDKELRQALLLRLIAIDRAIHSVLFGLIAAALIALRYRLGPLQRWAADLRTTLTSTLNQTGRNPSRDFLLRVLDRILNINRNSFGILVATAVVYCVIEGTEAVGLWRERRWAEYLTAVATAGFLPFEIHELLARTTVLRVAALTVNLAVLVYLVWAKHLFGIGAGRAGEPGSSDVDRNALFGPPTAEKRPARQSTSG